LIQLFQPPRLFAHLIWTEEEDLRVLPAREVDNGTLDPRRLARDEQVDDRLCQISADLAGYHLQGAARPTHIDIFLETLLVVRVDKRQDRALGSSLRDVLVLCTTTSATAPPIGVASHTSHSLRF
jgi:hypothetical protein